MQLALEMGMPLRQFRATVGADEFDKWIAFDRIHPVDATGRIERMLGILCSLFNNANSSTKRDWTHFVPDYAKLATTSGETKPAVDIAAKLMMITLAMGGKVLNGDGDDISGKANG